MHIKRIDNNHFRCFSIKDQILLFMIRFSNNDNFRCDKEKSVIKENYSNAKNSQKNVKNDKIQINDEKGGTLLS